MNKLHQAYIDLGLQPGAPLTDVLERWRTVARMWHPDRAGSEEERAIAEAELKKVNGARDLLMRHLQSAAHRSAGCECSISAERAQSAPPPQQPPPQSNSQTQGTHRTSPPPTQGSGARPGGRRSRKRQPKPDPKLMWLVTAGMLIVGWSIVHMNNGIRLRRTAELPAYGSAAPSLNSSSMTVAVQPNALFAVRPSPTGQIPEPVKRESTEEKNDKREEAAKKPVETPKNQSVISFVSSDGRLVSLKDGTTWELWQQEAADSFFQWEPGDQVIIKGPQSVPMWLVNQTRSYQAVKATPVR